MNMVEKVAKAMAAAESGPEGSSLFSVHWDEFGDGYMDSARIAIEAMREPTEAMKQEAWRVGIVSDGPIVYEAMISAALSEEKPE